LAGCWDRLLGPERWRSLRELFSPSGWLRIPLARDGPAGLTKEKRPLAAEAGRQG
jgi:hypothetical protein